MLWELFGRAIKESDLHLIIYEVFKEEPPFLDRSPRFHCAINCPT